MKQHDEILTPYSFAGYGNISPSSTAGQIFCVFFALFGIPLNMVVLNRVGKYMLVIERNLSDFLKEKTGRVRRSLITNDWVCWRFFRTWLTSPSRISLQRCTRFLVHLVSYLSGAVLFFIVPMIVFQQHEGWTYSQAIYYCFITLSTIGFGDFVAGTVLWTPPPEWPFNSFQVCISIFTLLCSLSLSFTDSNPDKKYPEWYSVLMASWIFFGLAWLALLINHSIDILERLNTHFKLRWCRQTKEESGSAEGDTPDTQVEEEDEIKKAPVTE